MDLLLLRYTNINILLLTNRRRWFYFWSDDFIMPFVFIFFSEFKNYLQVMFNFLNSTCNFAKKISPDIN